MPDSLLLAFEKGYNAIPGIVAQDVTTWGEMKQIYRQLKTDEVKARFKSLIIDTVDLAASCCEKWICDNNGIETLGDLGFGKGWSQFKKEFEDVFKNLTQMGYAIFFISHDKEIAEKDASGAETGRMLVRPALSSSPRAVIENICDIYGYAKTFYTENGPTVKLLLRSDDGRIACGCRFKYIDKVIDFNYDSLVNAITTAIDKEAQENNNKYITDEREAQVEKVTYDYNALKTEFQTIVGSLMETGSPTTAENITKIVEEYLGKGKKVSDSTPEQAEQLYWIIAELKEL